MSTDNQELLLVDNQDSFSGKYARRIDCHMGGGLHHRAVIVLLENEKAQVLLQKRKHTLFDGYWDITATTHVLHLSDGDESYEKAGKRALFNEMAVTEVTLKKVPHGFNYFAKEGLFCENEYCSIFTGNTTQKIVPNMDVVYEVKWVNKTDFIKRCLEKDKTLTPWAILTGELL